MYIKKILLISVILFYLTSCKNSSTENQHLDKEYSYEVKIIDEFPSPGPGPNALTYNSDYLWISDSIDAKIYKLDVTNREIIKEFAIQSSNINGITLKDNYLWYTDNDSIMLYKIDTNSELIIEEIDLRSEVFVPILPKSVSGLTFDGVNLYCIFGKLGWSSQIVRFNTTMDSTFFFAFVSSNAGDITYDGEFFWICWDKNYVEQIDHQGLPAKSFIAPGVRTTGITYDES